MTTAATGTTRYNTRDRNPARTWLIVLGVTLLALAFLGLFDPVVDFFHALRVNLEGGENGAHWVLGLLTLGLAFLVKDRDTLAKITIGYGVVYVLLGLLGFLPGFLDAGQFWHVDATDNILHLLIGAITIAAGYATRDPTRTRTGRPAI